jgi:hypothetical protein
LKGERVPTTNQKPKKIKAVIGLTKMTDANIMPLLDGSLKGLAAHLDIFTKLPVDPPTYEAGINAYKAAIPTALDGSRAAKAQKNKLRNAAVKMYELNAKYVEVTSNDDMPTFLLSGYQPASTTKAPPAPLPLPAIASIVQGPASGVLKAVIAPLPKALSFVLRHGVVPPGGGTPATWVEDTIPHKKPFFLSNLMPGTTYMFQVKALGRLGYTDWSDPISRMVT